ncbi:PLP-dependent aminotransferase family protein [Corynebacterium qintianiae]|uniref:MocR-like pyridoxine biosynthesis transcription factor PdxR n=1 Tax=Corynebacterium qintianiae TaxID=2709392 RepID=UPI0013ED072D|nr:PLP-dependent aminotransferase family protein [Corynebacterium qintianiae]
MFPIDRTLSTSLPNQIASGVRGLVASGRLAGGDRVPSTRELARQLGVSRGSVVSAYDQLISEGFLLSTQGANTVVHPDLPRRSLPPSSTAVRSPAPPRLRISLKPSSGHAGTIRPAAWRRAWRDAAQESPATIDKAGQPQLRTAIAQHLRLARGLTVDPNNVLVTGGSREGLLLILMSLGRNLRVGVESPGHPGLGAIIPLAGHTPVTCRTDAQGVIVSSLPPDLDALLVTPSHLYPVGGTMPAARRAALLEWAARNRVVVIEDDFNSELRYRVSPQPTLATLATEACVITLGTFSTLLSRHLSAGYVVADVAMADSLRVTRGLLGMPVSPVTQHAIARLLEGGFVRRNTKSVHSRLAHRREILSTSVLPALRLLGADIIEREESLGVDMVVRFSERSAQADFVATLTRLGVECGEVGTQSSEGLLLSFAHLDDADFDRAVEILSSVGKSATANPQSCTPRG